MSTYTVWGREVQESADDNTSIGAQGAEHVIYEGENREEYLNVKRNGGIYNGVWLVPSRWEDGARPEYSGTAVNATPPSGATQSPPKTPRKGEV